MIFPPVYHMVMMLGHHQTNEPGQSTTQPVDVQSPHTVDELDPQEMSSTTDSYHTLLLEGKTRDILVVNTGFETSWYRLEYADTVCDFSEFKVKRLRGIIEYSLVNLWYNGTFIFFVVSLMVLSPWSSFKEVIFNYVLIAGLTSMWLTVYYLEFKTVENNTGLGPDELTKRFPLVGTPRTFIEKHVRSRARLNSDIIPTYRHLLTISRYEESEEILSTDFAGFRIRRTDVNRYGKFIKGYGLFAVLNDGTQITLMPEKGIVKEKRQHLYEVINFSLHAIGRRVDQDGTGPHGAFLRGLKSKSNSDLVAFDSNIQYLIDQRSEFLADLSLSQIGIEAPALPEGYLDKYR